jgi:hypothetical protein
MTSGTISSRTSAVAHHCVLRSLEIAGHCQLSSGMPSRRNLELYNYNLLRLIKERETWDERKKHGH